MSGVPLDAGGSGGVAGERGRKRGWPAWCGHLLVQSLTSAKFTPSAK